MTDTIDDRLNPEFVKDKLLEIFNKNKDSTDNYTSEYVKSLYNDKISELIIISNNGNTCYKLNLPLYKNGQYIIIGGNNTRCGDNKSGTQNLKNIIQFGLENDYDVFELDNMSEINYNFLNHSKKSILLTALKLLETGNSWYSQFGFESFLEKGEEIPISKHLQKGILPIISNSLENLTKKYNEYIDFLFSQGKITTKNQDHLKTEFKKIMNDFIMLFNSENIPKLEITKSTIICDYIKNIIQIIIKKCPKNMCEENFNRLLQKMITFIYFLSYSTISIVTKNPEPVIVSDVKDVEIQLFEIIEDIYYSLELNLKKLRNGLGRGNKTIKQNKKRITQRKRKYKITKGRNSASRRYKKHKR